MVETAVKTKWSLDKTHSEIQFKARHLMITNVTGVFKNYEATIETDENDFTNAEITFTAEVDSLTTGNDQRDAHLKSDDFFNAEKYPQLKFVSTGMEKKDDNSYTLHGDMTIRETTKRISLAVEFEGIVQDPWGNTKAGFTITGKLNRKDFGLNWNVVTEAGGVLVSEEVKINCSIQLAKS